jgi:hypothetical protein
MVRKGDSVRIHIKQAVVAITFVLVIMGIQLVPLLAAEKSAEDLAKKVQIPVADLISVPFQNNFNFGVGPQDDLQYVLNIQPVIPITLSSQWNLITRTIVPVISQPGFARDQDRVNGIGDIQVTPFLSPRNSEGLIWGAGPIVQFPTNSEGRMGNDRWAVALGKSSTSDGCR